MIIGEAKKSSQVFHVIGCVNLLLEEVLRLTSKAPKKFRFSICKKMDDLDRNSMNLVK